MPLHNLKCVECEEKWEENIRVEDVEARRCPVCGGKIKVSYDWGSVGIDVFKPFISEEIDWHPIEITSKEQLARESAKRGLQNKGLQNGYRTYKTETRWI